MTAFGWNDNVNRCTRSSTSTDTIDLVNDNFTEGVVRTTRCHSSGYNLTTVNNDRNTTTSTVTFDGNVFICTVVITRTRRLDNNSINLTTNSVGDNCGVCEHRHVLVREELQHLSNRNGVHVLPTITVSSCDNRCRCTCRFNSGRFTVRVRRGCPVVNALINLVRGVDDKEVSVIQFSCTRRCSLSRTVIVTIHVIDITQTTSGLLRRCPVNTTNNLNSVVCQHPFQGD